MPVPLGQAFTYAVPAELVHEVSRGARVLIEFGRRKVLGIVLDVAEREPDVPLDKLKSLVAVVEQRPVLPLELLEFLQELARYYVAPIGEVMQLAVPAVERSQAKLLAHTGGARVIGRLLQVAKATGAEPSAALRGSAKPILEHLQQTVPLRSLSWRRSGRARAPRSNAWSRAASSRSRSAKRRATPSFPLPSRAIRRQSSLPLRTPR